MFSRFLPREEKFFNLFGELADLIVEGALEVRRLVQALDGREASAERMMEIERKGDKVTQRIIALLRTTFITPIDRDDMHHLVSEMDSILDALEAAAQRILIYDIRQLPEDASRLVEVCVAITELVRAAVNGLADLKNTEEILKNCVAINQLENDADLTLRGALASLFKQETDTRQLIKVKEIYEILEEATDRCEDVADIVDRIVLEHA